MERVHELPACKPLIGGALASPVAPAKMAAIERRSTRIRKSRICLSAKSADLRSFAFIRGQSAARRGGSLRRVVGRGRSRDGTVSRGTLATACPPRRGESQRTRPTLRHGGSSTRGRGSQRAVSDMPIKCPCEGPRRWFFREILARMGILNLRRGHVDDPPAHARPGKTRKVLVKRQQRFQLPFDGSLSLLAGDGAFIGQFTCFLRHNPQFRNRPLPRPNCCVDLSHK
jgi:hypothetical protein